MDWNGNGSLRQGINLAESPFGFKLDVATCNCTPTRTLNAVVSMIEVNKKDGFPMMVVKQNNRVLEARGL